MKVFQRSHPNGLYDYHAGVQAAFFVGDINHIIHKRAKEISFAKLQHPNGPLDAFPHVSVQQCQFLHLNRSSHFLKRLVINAKQIM